jgi:hypothetical protein
MFAIHQTTAGDLARLLDLVTTISELLHFAMFVGGCHPPVVRDKTVAQFLNNSGNSGRASLVQQTYQSRGH